MNNLPQIIEHEGRKVVSARELYEGLGHNPAHFARWSKKNITGNALAMEFEDWVPFTMKVNAEYQVVTNPKPTQDYALTLDFAKRLAMMARTEQGERIRRYFIQCEETAKNPPLSEIELVLRSAQILADQQRNLSRIEQGQKQIETRMDMMEAKATTTPNDYFAIAGYASLVRRPINVKMAAALGARAKSMCNMMGYSVGNIPDPRFGRVNTYPKGVLEAVFKDYFHSA